ncbi:MAG TPA: Hpt domain-containing protein, partial [Syntrophothermus lipocalidus]|nr:Hpt domain-containing protein [Syntrophothermus lipocalidus]
MRLTFEPDDIDILQGIVEESSEHLRGIEEGILRLEADFDPETVDSVFRALHSVKGVAGLLDLTPIKDCAHCLESMLTDIRKGLYIPDSEITDLLLRGVDVLHLQLAEVVAQLQELQADPPQEPFALNIPDAGGKELAATVEEIRLRLTGQSQPEPDEEARPE